MIDPSVRPKLAAKVRLRFDRHSGRHWLLYPERGLDLNESAYRIAVMCTGEWTVAQVVAALQRETPEVPESQLQADVQHFLDALHARGLVQLL